MDTGFVTLQEPSGTSSIKLELLVELPLCSLRCTRVVSGMPAVTDTVVSPRYARALIEHAVAIGSLPRDTATALLGRREFETT